ncbi:hypothetical protein I302_101879 [Kwoniella bestiolae CBS 10118]|uniref:Aminoglycoside phosphotransferase domain-containing protein n=1 Tax=Kwoniella bestiolae CBS 10118 TaxID=1296100 RepID=A0A1B9GDG8_9TREE|nr:hypothetical protein I302_00558 [Kwoniella bestiolae CBS 10118]OCF29067.1 hypothetical protein I302_00558 [Kwoniella bestiolae CBS 10118]
MKIPDFAKCAIEDCQAYALFKFDPCTTCGVEEEIAEILEIIDFDKVTEEVESLRPPHRCIKIDKFESPYHVNQFNGSFNFHLVIDFDVGTKWVMRIRWKQTRLQPDEAIEMCMRSEIATLKALFDGGARVTRSYERPRHSTVSSELMYFYQEFVKGFPTHCVFGPMTPKPMTSTCMKSYAAWMISLEKITFNKAGSLRLTDRGEVVFGSHIERDRTALIHPPYYLGPFNTAKERWLSTIAWKMRSILDKREVKPSEELLCYLSMLEMKDLVSGCEELEKGPRYIKHYDLHGRHDKDTGELNALLDWEWASLTCKAEAFIPPDCFRVEGRNPCSSDLGETERLLVEAYVELGRPDLIQLIRGGRKYHWIHIIVLRTHFSVGALNAARGAFLGLSDDWTGYPETVEEWRDMMLNRYREDDGVKELLSRQKMKYPPKPTRSAVKKRSSKKSNDKRASVEVVEAGL